MLKTLSHKHRELLRRLVVGQDTKIIEQELNVSAATINRLQKSEPLFISELVALQDAADKQVTDSMERISVMEKLNETAHDAVRLCQNIIRGNEVDASVDLRLKSAWDVLDRTNHGKTEKKDISVFNASDMIIAAYNAKHKKDDKAANAIDV